MAKMAKSAEVTVKVTDLQEFKALAAVGAKALGLLLMARPNELLNDPSMEAWLRSREEVMVEMDAMMGSSDWRML